MAKAVVPSQQNVVPSGTSQQGAAEASAVATFISKVWKIVEKTEHNPLISWTVSGKSFIVHDYSSFAKDILPLYFKHNNFNSFVRQLNLYGFRKVSQPDQGSLVKVQLNEPVEFWHANFRRGHPELLHLVQRRQVVSREGSGEKHAQISMVMGDLHQMKGRQETIANVLDTMKQDNNRLRRDLTLLKDKHLRQQRVLNKIIQFLVHMVYEGRVPGSRRRSGRLMLMDRGEAMPPPSPKRLKGDDSPVEIDISAYEVQSPQDFLTTPVSVQSAASNPTPPISPQGTSAGTQDNSILPTPFLSSSVEDNSPTLLPSTSLVPTSFPVPPPSFIDHSQQLVPATTTALTPMSFPSISENPGSLGGTGLADDLAITIPHDLLEEFALYPPPQSLVSALPDNCKNCISGHLDHQQQGLDAFPELLSGQFSIDPAIVANFLSADANSPPQYDIVDTARLLEALSDTGDADTLTCNFPLPAIPPSPDDSAHSPQLEELLKSIPTSSPALTYSTS